MSRFMLCLTCLPKLCRLLRYNTPRCQLDSTASRLPVIAHSDSRRLTQGSTRFLVLGLVARRRHNARVLRSEPEVLCERCLALLSVRARSLARPLTLLNVTRHGVVVVHIVVGIGEGVKLCSGTSKYNTERRNHQKKKGSDTASRDNSVSMLQLGAYQRGVIAKQETLLHGRGLVRKPSNRRVELDREL